MQPSIPQPRRRRCEKPHRAGFAAAENYSHHVGIRWSSRGTELAGRCSRPYLGQSRRRGFQSKRHRERPFFCISVLTGAQSRQRHRRFPPGRRFGWRWFDEEMDESCMEFCAMVLAFQRPHVGTSSDRCSSLDQLWAATDQKSAEFPELGYGRGPRTLHSRFSNGRKSTPDDSFGPCAGWLPE